MLLGGSEQVLVENADSLVDCRVRLAWVYGYQWPVAWIGCGY